MARWTCPNCQREFGRANQSHTCAPSSTVDDYFAGRPEVQREIYELVASHLESLGPVLVDPVQACVMFKRERSFAEVRSKRKALTLTFLLSRTVDSKRVVRSQQCSANRYACYVDLAEPEDVDDEVRAWLTEAYLDSKVDG